MSDMLSYEAVQLKKLLAEEKDIRNRYISAAEEISDPQLKEKLQKCAAVHGSHISVINGLTGRRMIDEKNRLNELLRAENSLAQKYAVILCSAVSGDIRTKLTFNQRGINEAASFIIDEMNSRGWNVPKSVLPPKN